MNINASHRSTPSSRATSNAPGQAPVNRSDDFGSGQDWYMDSSNYSPRYSNPPRTLEEIRRGQPGDGASWTDWIKWIFNMQ